MIKYKLLKEHGLTPRTITKNKKAFILETDDEKYVIKEGETSLDKTYKYLNSRGFNYFPNYQIIDNYMLYNYISSIEEDESQKLEDLVYLTSLLHLKTTRFSETDLDDYKIIYEELDKRIEDALNYYTNLNDKIDNEIYMSPSYYLLARNISKIYGAISFARRELDNWYELVKKEDKRRKVLIHNNLDTSHLLKNKNNYLISFSKSKVDLPIYDLYNLYEKYNSIYDFGHLLNIYENKYPLSKDELILLFIYISIPDRIEFTNDEYLNTLKVKELLVKLSNGDKLIKPYYSQKEVADKKK